MTTRLLTLRITPGERALILRLVTMLGLRTMSDAVRTAVREAVARRDNPEYLQ